MIILNLFSKLNKSCKGSTSVIIICTSIIVILVSALVTDVGYAAMQRYKLTSSAEMVAKAGAEILVKNRDEAFKFMKKYAVSKNNELTGLDIKIADNNREISVYMKKTFNYLFLSFIGFKEKQIETHVTVKLSGVVSFKGVRPFAVQSRKFSFGKQYTLADYKAVKDGAISFVPLNIGNGSYKSNILYGFMKSLKVGDGVYAMVGDIVKDSVDAIGNLLAKCNHEPECTYDNYLENCSRIMVIPVVDKIDYSGKDAMNILGFTAFFIEKYHEKDNHIFITGRFIRHTVNAKTSDDVVDFGLSGIKFVR